MDPTEGQTGAQNNIMPDSLKTAHHMYTNENCHLQVVSPWGQCAYSRDTSTLQNILGIPNSEMASGSMTHSFEYPHQ